MRVEQEAIRSGAAGAVEDATGAVIGDAGGGLVTAIEILQRALQYALREASQVDAKVNAQVTCTGAPGFVARSLAEERRDAVPTAVAAWHIGRQPQTLRAWACTERGPIRPIRVGCRLMWRTDALRRVVAAGAGQ